MQPYYPAGSSASRPVAAPVHDDSELPRIYFPNGVPLTRNHQPRNTAFQKELQSAYDAAIHAQRARQNVEWKIASASVEAYEAKWTTIVSVPNKRLRNNEDIPFPVVSRKSTNGPGLEDITYINVFRCIVQAVLMHPQYAGGYRDGSTFLMQMKLRTAQEMARWKEETFANVASRFLPSGRAHVVSVAEKVRNALLEIDEDLRAV